MTKDTYCDKNCPFVKQGFCDKVEECPNYVESIWEDALTKECKVVKDCSPKRVMLETQIQRSRIDSLQTSLDEQRHAFATMARNFNILLGELDNAMIRKSISSTKEVIEDGSVTEKDMLEMQNREV